MRAGFRGGEADVDERYNHCKASEHSRVASTIQPGADDGCESLATCRRSERFQTESAADLLDLTQESPVLLIFLRHFGCSFCRETLDRVSQIRSTLKSRGVRPVFVHLGTPERAKPYFEYYQLGDVERISNPDATLYGILHLILAAPIPEPLLSTRRG